MLGIDHGVMVCHVHHRILIAIRGDNFNKNRPIKRIYSFHGFQFTSSVTSLFDKAFQDMNASGKSEADEVIALSFLKLVFSSYRCVSKTIKNQSKRLTSNMNH